MWEYIVLGRIPGTSLQIGFYTFVLLIAAISTGRFRVVLGHNRQHKRKSMLAAKTAVGSLVLRPDPEPVQMELL
jgi:hypothetical protein